MSKKTFYNTLATYIVAASFATPMGVIANEEAEEVKTEVVNSQEASKNEQKPLDVPKISEAFGHLIHKNILSLGIDFDMEKVIKGIQDSIAGAESPIADNECVHILNAEQERIFNKMANDNLKVAENFLEENAAKEGIISMEENKIQYKVEQAGEGAVVEEHFTPLVKYSGKLLDGKVFAPEFGEAQPISLDDVIAGFSKGVVGMKEGEKRTVYIHPDYAYGTNGSLPPNSLLTFEIEVCKANQEEMEDGSDTISSNDELDDTDDQSDEDFTESVQ